MKLCVECKHHLEVPGPVHQCMRGVIPMRSLIDGKDMNEGVKYCRTQRYETEQWHCGPVGKFWEAK